MPTKPLACGTWLRALQLRRLEPSSWKKIDTTVFPRIALAAAQLRFKIEHRRIEWGGGERVQFTFRTAAAAVTLKS